MERGPASGGRGKGGNYKERDSAEDSSEEEWMEWVLRKTRHVYAVSNLS